MTKIEQKLNTWRKVKLGEIVIPKGSVSGPFGSNIHSKFFIREGVPVIRGNNLAIGFNPSRYVDDDYIFLSEQKAEELSKSEASPEDIIVTARGTIGQTGIIPKKSRYKKYILSANQLRFRIDRKIANPLFVYYWLASKMMVRTMQNVSVNVGVPNLNLGNTRNLPVPVPPLPIQERIADILSVFDDKIELNNKISRTLEQMAQTIFKEWFVNFRFSGHEKVKLVDSELGEIPEGWELVSVEQLVKRLPQGKTYRPEELKQKGSVPVYDQSSGIILGYHDGDPAFSATIDEPVIVFGDHTCRMKLIIHPCSLGPNVVPFIGKSYPAAFIYYLTKEGIVQHEYKRHWTEFEQQEFIVPPAELAVEFVSYVKPLVQKIVEIESENQKLAALRDLVLPKLMSGEIRV